MRNLKWTTVILALLASTACIFRGPEDLRRDLQASAGVELDKEMGVTVGRFGIAVARVFTKQEEVPLKGVRKVEVGVYEVVGTRKGVDERRPLAVAEMPGYQPVVRVHEGNEDVFVMLKMDEQERIRRMLVIVAENDEWVLVRIRGKLDRIVERAMEMAFDEADKPELYEPALADYRQRKSEASG
jgi:hypothetical protein